MDGYARLANAIIEQAADDYRAARWKLRKEPDNALQRKKLNEVVRFFLSRWCGTFLVHTNLDGATILKRLKEEG